MRRVAFWLALAVPLWSGAGTLGAEVPAPGGSRTQASRLLPLAQPIWSALPESHQRILAPLESQWDALPLTRKRAWVLLADKLPGMQQSDREKAEARILEWTQLTPEQRLQARNNYRLAKTLPRDARIATWAQYQQMTPEQRAVLRQQGWTSNTAAGHAGASTGLAKQAARPMPGLVPPAPPALDEPIPPTPNFPAAPAQEPAPPETTDP